MSRDSTIKNAELPIPLELHQALPLKPEAKRFVQSSRKKLENILQGHDPRKVIVAGPCSVHHPDASREYAARLKKLSDRVADKLLIIMRLYFEKPRTVMGWKGYYLDPHLDGSHDIAFGITATRRLLVDTAEIGLPTAAEFLSPFSPAYFGDLVTWGCIGSRTAESQTHREMASALPMPVAFKNNTNGNIGVAIKGMISAMHPHSFIALNSDGTVGICHSDGNPYSHLVLRGGEGKPNYFPQTVASATMMMQEHGITPAIIIDCSHDNSERDHHKQPIVFHEVLRQMLDGNQTIKGMILESNILAGKQEASAAHDPHISITDSCMGWERTEELILEAADALRTAPINEDSPNDSEIAITR